MPKFICENCNYTTNRKYRYNRHIENKNGCKLKIKLDCKYCWFTFTTTTTHAKHLKICPTKKKGICKYCSVTYSCVSALNKHLKICKENPINAVENEYQCTYCDLYFVKEEFNKHFLNCMNTHKNTVVNNITNNNTTNNNDNSSTINNIDNSIIDNSTNVTQIHQHIAILNFGNEDLSHITSKKLKQCYLDPKNSITKLVDYVHFDKFHPNNRNLKIDEGDSKHIKIYNGNSWQYEKIRPTLKNIADEKFKILERRYDECIDNMSSIAKKDWDNFYYNYLGDEPFVLNHVHDGLVFLLKKHVYPSITSI